MSKTLSVLSILALLILLPACEKPDNLVALPTGQGAGVSEAQAIALPRTLGFPVSSIVYYDAQDLDVQGFAFAKEEGPLTVTDYGPVGELPVENKRPTIYAVFSLPMTPLAKLGDPMTSSPLLRITPAIKGVFRWYGSRLLSFEPDEPLLSQRRYTVTVTRDAASLGGQRLKDERSFEFYSEYLDIAEFHPGRPDRQFEIDRNDVPLADARYLTVRFNYPVNMAVVGRFIRVEAGGRSIGFSLDRPVVEAGPGAENLKDRSVLLTLKEQPPENTPMVFRLLQGARSEEDYIGRPKPAERKYHTLKPFAYRDFDTWSYSFPRSAGGDANPVYLRFSHPLEEKDPARFFSTSFTEVKNLKEHISVWQNIVKISNLPVRYESTYSITVSKNLSDIYGRKLGADKVIRVSVGKARSYAYFPNTGSRMLEAQYPPKIVFEYQNVPYGFWKAGAIDDPYPDKGISFAEDELEPYDLSGARPNVKQYRVLDLAPFLHGGKGAVGVSWKFATVNSRGKVHKGYHENLNLQVTDLGITARCAYNKVLVWAASLSTGAPVADARVSLLFGHRTTVKTGRTDARGLAVIDLAPGQYRSAFTVPERNWRRDELRILVEKDGDRAEFKPNDSHNVWRFDVDATSEPGRIEEEVMHTFLITDRGLYKPGETLTFRGIDRNIAAGKFSVYEGPYEILIREAGWRTQPILTQRGRTTSTGGFYGTFTLPPALEPGNFYLEYKRDGKETSIYFQVAQFRRLTFQARMEKPEREFYLEDNLSFRIKASYLSGGDLSGASYEYYWYKEAESFKPAGVAWKDWDFGPDNWDGYTHLSSGKGLLDASGGALISQATTREGLEGKAYRYNAEARVQDVSRQEIAARQSVVVHPAQFYIGARLPASQDGWWTRFVAAKKALAVEVALVRPDGAPYAGDANVTLKLIKETWKVSQQRGVYGRVNSMYERVEEVKQEEKISVRGGRASWTVTPEEAGSYIVRLSGADEKSRKAVTDLDFYATGAEWVRWSAEDSDTIDLMVDKEQYAPGETARLMVRSPLPKGQYLLTLEREGIFEEKIITLNGSQGLIEVPVKDEYVPVFYVALSSYSKREAQPASYFGPDLGKPKGYFGIAKVAVSTKTRTFDVTIEPAKDVFLPGSRAEVTITVTRNGKPVPNAEVTYLAVDRGVLDLIGYHVPDPVSFFYNQSCFPLAVKGADSRSLLIDPVTYELKDLQGGGGDDEKMQKRKDFTPLAVFEPYLKTDARGKAVVRFKLPDTLTTYRSTAIVAEKETFGLGEKELLVQNPLNARSVLPRRMRVRDTAVGSCLLTNVSGQAQSVTVSLAAKNLGVYGQAEKTVTVKARETLTVPFSLMATTAGRATLLFTIRSPVLKEQLEDTLVVEQPLIKEAFTVMGQTDKVDAADTSQAYAEEGFAIPGSIAPGYGSLVVRLDSSRLTSLGEAVEYLLHYPHGCAEQRLSQILPYILFGDSLEVFGSRYSGVFKPSLVSDLFALLGKYQRPDGGVSFWLESGYNSDPYVSVKVAHYAALAERKGIRVSDKLRLADLNSYLRGLYVKKYTPDYLKMYSLYVQSLARDDVRPRLKEMLGKRDQLGIAGYALAALSYLELGDTQTAGALLGRIKNFIKVGTRSIDLIETYESRYYFDSNVQQLALLLMLYRKLDPGSDMVTRVANALRQRQQHGYWVNTADTAWALIAYSQVFDNESGRSTDFLADVKVNNAQIVSERFKGVSSRPVIAELPFTDGPLAALDRNKLFPVLLEKRGAGTLFYNMTIRYALPAEIVLARDEGFSLYTELYDLDGKKLEGRELMAGETYRMRAVLSTSKRRMFVALRVPVPSGADIVDASFVTTGSYLDKGGTDARSWARETIYGDEFTFTGEGNAYLTEDGLYFSFQRPVQKIMDNEVVYYFNDFYNGKNEIDFLFRAVIPGVYPTPPAYAVCMYEEEVFGRSAGALYVIKDK